MVTGLSVFRMLFWKLKKSPKDILAFLLHSFSKIVSVFIAFCSDTTWHINMYFDCINKRKNVDN